MIDTPIVLKDIFPDPRAVTIQLSYLESTCKLAQRGLLDFFSGSVGSEWMTLDDSTSFNDSLRVTGHSAASRLPVSAWRSLLDSQNIPTGPLNH